MPMLYRLDLVFQDLPASVTARTPGRLRDPQVARPPGRFSSPPPTVPRPPELPLSARAVDLQPRAVHRLPVQLPFLACKNGRYDITPRVRNAPARATASTSNMINTTT